MDGSFLPAALRLAQAGRNFEKVSQGWPNLIINPMRVLGIDPGSNITGYGIVEKNGRELSTIKWGAIRTKRNQSFPEKLKIIYDDLIGIVKSYEPSIAAIENIFFSVNANSALKLGQVRGATILAALNSGLEIAEYTPLEIKLSLTGYGRADKNQVQSMVTKLLRLKENPKPLDSSDALAVAICHLHSAAFKQKCNISAQRNRNQKNLNAKSQRTQRKKI